MCSISSARVCVSALTGTSSEANLDKLNPHAWGGGGGGGGDGGGDEFGGRMAQFVL